MKLRQGDIVYIQKEDNSDPDKWHKSNEIYVIRDQSEQSVHLKVTHKISDDDFVEYKELIYAKLSKIFLYFAGYGRMKELDYLELNLICAELEIPSQVVEKFVNVCNGEKINKSKIHYVYL